MAATACNALLKDVRRVLAGDGTHNEQRTALILVASVFFALFPLDISQLVMLLVGAAAYGLMQPLVVPPPGPTSAPRKSAAAKKYVPPALRSQGGGKQGPCTENPEAATMAAKAAAAVPPRDPTACTITKTVKPIAPLALQTGDWAAQVDELVSKLEPSVAGDRAVELLVSQVRRIVQHVVPEAEVAGFASGTPLRSRPFAVAVPDVDLVIACPVPVLVSRLQAAGVRLGAADRRNLLKGVLRDFTDRLVAKGGFKFRRSAFQMEEPRTTLMPAGDGDSAVPINLSVNIATPAHNAALLAECARLDPRARALALLVRRWACDRGICQASQGHLAPYAWTLLTIFFLQAGLSDGDDAKLPCFGDFELRVSGAASLPGAVSCSGKSVGELFEKFVNFYATEFDLRSEAISIRTAERKQKVSSAKVGPVVEDPFESGRNVGATLSDEGFRRLREELARARMLLAVGGTTVIAMLEPWVPPGVPSKA